MNHRRGRLLSLPQNFHIGVLAQLLAEGLPSEWFVIKMNSVAIFLEGVSKTVNSDQSKSTIVMYLLYFVWSQPTSLEFPRKFLKPGIVQKCPVFFVEDFIFNERIMPFSSLVLDKCGVLECRELDFIELIDLL